MARSRLAAGCLVLALSFGSILAGCAGQHAQATARQACAHVERGLAAEHKAATVGPAQAARLETEALDQMRAALPLAAVAANADTTWQPLEATLSESNRVPLRYLLPALADQCAGSGNNG
ncbi:MAG: hypothetical protein ACLQCU_11455 [Acidimicrobiales bacterium]